MQRASAGFFFELNLSCSFAALLSQSVVDLINISFGIKRQFVIFILMYLQLSFKQRYLTTVTKLQWQKEQHIREASMRNSFFLEYQKLQMQKSC